MSQFSEPNYKDASQKLQVWCCDNCQAVHFKAGNVMLNFTKNEFSDLTHAMMDIYQEQFGGLEFYKLVNSLTHEQDDDILLSHTIS